MASCLTERGRQTRAKLVEAARTVFENCDFRDSRVRDITKEAGVAYGSFYTYFPSKESVVREVGMAVAQEMMVGPDAESGVEADLVGMELEEDSPQARSRRVYDRVLRANRFYLESFARNARLLAAIDQMALYNDELFQIRQDMRRDIGERSRSTIAHWQAEGLVDSELDPAYAGAALGSMVYRFAYTWFTFGGDFELEAAARNLSRLWVQALGMTVETELPPTRHATSAAERCA